MIKTLMILLPVFALNGGFQVAGFTGGADSLRVNTTGEHNQVVLNDQQVEADLATDSLQLSGEITQTGEFNSVEIAAESASENSNQNNVITITQTGKNNSVKINSR